VNGRGGGDCWKRGGGLRVGRGGREQEVVLYCRCSCRKSFVPFCIANQENADVSADHNMMYLIVMGNYNFSMAKLYCSFCGRFIIKLHYLFLFVIQLRNDDIGHCPFYICLRRTGHFTTFSVCSETFCSCIGRLDWPIIDLNCIKETQDLKKLQGRVVPCIFLRVDFSYVYDVRVHVQVHCVGNLSPAGLGTK
jgi:hypothetical protein